MGFHEKDSFVRVDRFRETGKWYDTYMIDMEPYYNDVSVYDAVRKAWRDRYNWGSGDGLTGFFLVCLEPYHRNSFPILLRSE